MDEAVQQSEAAREGNAAATVSASGAPEGNTVDAGAGQALQEQPLPAASASEPTATGTEAAVLAADQAPAAAPEQGTKQEDPAEAMAMVGPYLSGDGSEARAAGPDEGAVFVSHREVRRQGPKTSKKHRTTMHFYLVDLKGSETLAAIGEDQGDAHYIYRNMPGFGKYGDISCGNRKDVITWLELIMHRTQEAAGYHAEIETEEANNPEAAIVDNAERIRHHLPTFVAYRHEKFQYEDGRRGNKWYLVDEAGHEHMAVVGEERDTRDGHYLYRAEEPYATVHPLACGNMSGVNQWLDAMVSHPHGSDSNVGAAAVGGAGGADSGRRPLREAKPSASVQSASLHRKEAKSRAAGSALSGGAVTSKHSGAATQRGASNLGKRSALQAALAAELTSAAAIKRAKVPGRAPTADEVAATEAVAKEAVLAELRRRGCEEEAQREAVRRAALDWVRAPLAPDDLELLRIHLAALRDTLAVLDKLQPPAIDQNYGAPSADEGDAPIELAAGGREEGPPNGLLSLALVDYTSDDEPHAHPPAPAPQEGAGAAALATANGTGERGSAAQEAARRYAVAVTEVLECLREIGSIAVPLRMLAATGAVAAVTPVASHPEPAVAGLAGAVLGQWRGSLARQLGALTQPHLLADPLAALEARLHHLQAPQAPAPSAPATSSAPAAAAAAAAPAASVSGTAAGGGTALGPGDGGGQTPGRLATTTAGQQGGEGAAAAAGQAAQRTVERRRLERDLKDAQTPVLSSSSQPRQAVSLSDAAATSQPPALPAASVAVVESESEDEWAQCGDLDEEDDPIWEPDAGPVSRAVTLLRGGKGRLAACRHGEVLAVVTATVAAAQRQLEQLPDWDASSTEFRHALDLGERLVNEATKMSRNKTAARNKQLKKGVIAIMERLVLSVELLE